MPARLKLTPWFWGGLVLVLLLTPLPLDSLQRRWPALLLELENICHPIAFGVLTHLAFGKLRERFPLPSLAPYFWGLVIGVVGGGATEYAQSFTGRDASWLDFANDVAGTVLALLLRARSEQKRPVPRWGLTALVVAVGCATVAPLLFTLSAYAWRSMRAPVLWRSDELPFRRFAHWRQLRFTVLEVTEPPADWRRWNFLELDVENQQEVPLQLFVGIDELRPRDFRDWGTGRFEVAAGARETLRIRLEDLRTAPSGKAVDLTAIGRVVVVGGAGEWQQARFSVHEIRLAQ